MNLKPLKVAGDCESCTTSVNVILYELHGMNMCESCALSDMNASQKAIEANSMIQAARVVDTSIEIKPDVFNAKSVAIQQEMAAIMHDTNIHDADKNYVMASECLRHFQHMRAVIFQEKQEFAEKMAAMENELRAWQVQVHTFAAKVEGARRETFKNFDINYSPKVVKVTKSTTSTKAPSTYKKPTKHELADAAIKYNLPMAAIAMQALQFNMSAEEAGRAITANRNRIATETK